MALATLQRAPLIPLTVEEEALLAEVEGQPVRWHAHEDVVANRRARSLQG